MESRIKRNFDPEERERRELPKLSSVGEIPVWHDTHENEDTLRVRTRLERNLGKYLSGTFEADFERLTPWQRVQALPKILGYILPRLKAIGLSVEERPEENDPFRLFLDGPEERPGDRAENPTALR